MTPRLPTIALGILVAAAACGEDEAGSDGGEGGGPSAGSGGTQTGDASTHLDAGFGGGGAARTSDPNDIHACTGPGQCVLVDAARDCCVPKCGEQTAAFFDAIHVDHSLGWYEGQVCAGCLEPCSGAEREAFTRSTRTVIAVCEDGRCRPRDIAESEVTACTRDAECVLRWGSSCCEDRTENRNILIAYSNRDLLRELTCKDRFTACGARPDPPSDVRAVCGPSGYCEALLEEDAGTANGDAGP